jgi:hypothetical protein
MGTDAADELVEHLSRTAPVPAGTAARLVAEVVDYFSEPVEDFIRRRHGELQASGLTNAHIFSRLAAELAEWRFAPPPLSERQLRRIVYG